MRISAIVIVLSRGSAVIYYSNSEIAECYLQLATDGFCYVGLQ